MGWTCGHTGKASAVPHNTSASTSWILVKVDMLSSVCSSVHPGELLGQPRIPRELVAKLAQELSRARKVLLAFGNGQKHAGVRSKLIPIAQPLWRE